VASGGAREVILLLNTTTRRASRDRNANRVPDECETFRRGDCNGDGGLRD
jgi:hypothetical protein